MRAIFGDLLRYTSGDRLDIAAIATLDSDFDVYRRYRKKHERARVFAIARRKGAFGQTQALFYQTMQSVIEAIACEIPCHPDFAFICWESDQVQHFLNL